MMTNIDLGAEQLCFGPRGQMAWSIADNPSRRNALSMALRPGRSDGRPIYGHCQATGAILALLADVAVVTHDTLLAEAAANEVLEAGPKAGTRWNRAVQGDLERVSSAATDEAKEGLAALVERRPPTWSFRNWEGRAGSNQGDTT